MLSIRTGLLPPATKDQSTIIRCPGKRWLRGAHVPCLHRLFDGIFIGAIEIRCPSCKQMIVVSRDSIEAVDADIHQVCDDLLTALPT